MKLTVTIPNAVIVWNHNTGRLIVRNVAYRATFGDLADVQAELGLEPEGPELGAHPELQAGGRRLA